ncbi:MarR family transcriptional regulator [Streptomyces sp. NPDC017936]|uniref:MarR family transcriptional regulator n=1 Tax=Streptomyces sp. NPDC017936 TaxID=3365016 RepID=UPI0037B05650
MTTTAPLLDPRVVALAHYAARAVLETVLARHGVDFQQSVVLRLAAVADGPVERDEVVAGAVDALKTDPAATHGVIDELVAARLLAPDGTSRLRITDAGRELYDRTTRETAPFTARIYAGIPTEDLAVAGRVLSLITERADGELAALNK